MKEIKTNILGVVDSKTITLAVLCIILLIVLVALIGLLVFKFIKRNTRNKFTTDLNKTNLKVNKLDSLISEVKKTNQKLTKKLEEVSGMSAQQAKAELIKKLDNDLSNYTNNRIHKANEEIDNNVNAYAQQAIIDAMQNVVEDSLINSTTYTIKLKNDNVKGHIIGKNGKNIIAFKEITGVDVIIDKEPTITLSSFNPKKREIARLTMNKMLSKNIDPLSIKDIYDEQVAIFNKTVLDYGRKAVENDLKIYDLNKDLYPYIGNLFFRTSFSQNVLKHSIEVAKLCENLAKQFNLDPIEAKKIGLLHDIGKAIDYGTNKDHVSQGVILAKRYYNNPNLINAIASHHNNQKPNNIYSWIVRVADTISAARPGARNSTTKDYLKRIAEMEKICMGFEGVKEAHVYHAGRTLLVFVDPIKVSEEKYEQLAFKISKTLEENSLTNFLKIDITINRTNTFTTSTTPKIK